MRGFLTVAAILLGTQIFASSGVRVIDAESALKEREGLNLSRYATSIKYIPLETGLIYLPEAADISLYVKDGEYYLVSKNDTNGTGCYKYGNDGAFVSTFIRHGRGPGECVGLVDSDMDYNSGNIAVANMFVEILVYGKDGGYLHSVPLPGYVRHPRVLYVGPDSLLISVNNMQESKEEIYVAGKDRIFKKSMTAGDLHTEYSMFAGRRSSTNCRYDIFKCGGEGYIISQATDTVYSVKGDFKKQARYFLDFGKFRDESAYEDCHSGEGIHILPEGSRFGNSRFFCLRLLIPVDMDERLSLNERMIPFIYDVASNKAYAPKSKGDAMLNGFTNDLDGGAPFWPHVIYEDKMYQLVDAIDFMEAAEKSSSVQMKRVAAQLTEDSNPVLVEVTLKK